MRLADVVAHSRELRVIRERTVDDLWGFCRGCYYAETCKGGCTWTSHCLLGRPGNNPYCIHRALELEQQGLRERVVKVEAAPGLPFDNGRFEIVVEPMPETGDTPSLVGVPLADVLALKSSSAGAWTGAERTDRLAIE